MKLSELDEWADDFEAFHSRFVPLLGRRETREQAVKYLHGLISPVERKNSWQLAEAVGDKTPDATQRLLYSTKWDADAVRDELQRFVIEQFGDADNAGQDIVEIVGNTGRELADRSQPFLLMNSLLDGSLLRNITND